VSDERQTAPADGEALPRRFGKYTLMRKLATGGMAELYLAIHRSISGFEKLVVIKQILPQFTADPDFVQMFMDEARIAATLSHPNIIQIFDVGAVGDRYFIAMEFIHGEDLRAIVRGMVARGLREFPVEHTLGIATGVCAALDYAHTRKGFGDEDLHIVHRDISPQNILVTFTGDVKLVDFGIAKAALKRRADALADGAAAPPPEAQLRGKFPYMSPEQCRGLQLDHRSDIFSLGIILFELTTGRRLFRGKSEVETIRKIVEDPYPRPSQVRQSYPPALEAIVMRALARDRDARYQSAREMQADIEGFVREERVPVSSIALSNFMHDLFGDKLAAQRQAMAEGKQLADVIAASESEGGEIRFEEIIESSASQTTGGTPHATAAGALVARRPAKPRGLLYAAAGFGASVAAGVVLYLLFGRAPETPSTTPAPVDGAAAAEAVAATPPDVAPPPPPPVADVPPPPPVAEGVLLLRHVPPGMKVFIDDQFVFQNDGSAARDQPVPRIRAGDHVLRLDHPDYLADEFSIGLPPEARAAVEPYGEGWTVDVSAPSYVRPLAEGEAWVSLTVVEPDAVLTINGQPAAYRPNVPLRVRARLVNGRIDVDVTKRGFDAWRRAFRPEAATPQEVAVAEPISLTRSTGPGPRPDAGPPTPGGVGNLRVRCDPWAAVTIPGHGSRNTPFSIDLPAGTYRLGFSNPEQGRTASATVTITAGGSAKITDCW
jgi:serine/threonine-protein kinase